MSDNKPVHVCPDCGLPCDAFGPVDPETLVNPCPMCGATLKDNDTGECIFCKRV